MAEVSKIVRLVAVSQGWAEQRQWWIDSCFRFPFFLSLSCPFSDYWPTHLPTHPFSPTCLPTYLSIHPSISLSIMFRSFFYLLSVSLSIYRSSYLQYLIYPMYLIYLTCLLYLPPMVVRTPQHFDLECASCHSSVQFFNIWTSKSSPDMVCSVHFGFKMRFVPQWRAIVRHADFQKQSEAEPSRPTNHWKNTVFRDLPNVSHTLLFWLFSFPSATLLSSTLLFSAFHLFILSEVWLQNFLW